MKTKTVARVIQAKVDAWLASIEDEQVRTLARQNAIVTGGCIPSLLSGEPINDFDVYFRTRDAVLAVAKYYIGRFDPASKKGIACAISIDEQPDRIRIVVKSAGIASEDGSAKPYEYFEARPAGEAQEYVEDVMGADAVEDAHEATEAQVLDQDGDDDGKPNYRPVFLSTNAITLSQRVQIVLRFYGEPEQIHENYDFVHCTNYWTADGGLVLRQPALESLITRELRYVGSKYPVCSVMRLRKFIKRGWTINAGQILKMVMQIDALELTKLEVLQDQLTGVDCAYFAQVLEKLHDKDPTKINSAYLVEIIDRMF